MSLTFRYKLFWATCVSFLFGLAYWMLLYSESSVGSADPDECAPVRTGKYSCVNLRQSLQHQIDSIPPTG